MVLVHKYVDYGVSIALTFGMQRVFAPGIPYYSMGALASHLTVKPVFDWIANSAVGYKQTLYLYHGF